ncbi:hypothetical protein RYH80_06220 [Halobaculum sp. MBLA0147]|uniref:hypothetical protein n=1 Tax=Halobaculum sp. MBLA0147 TaxID=3079934 RepID=UPI003524AB78
MTDRFPVPRGSLLRAHTVASLATPLSRALTAERTGYVVVESGDRLLSTDATRGVVTLAAGIPVLAYETRTQRGGADALDALAAPAPPRVEVYQTEPDALDTVHDHEDCRVSPGAPARRLAADDRLAAETRARAPADRVSRDALAEEATTDAVENAGFTPGSDATRPASADEPETPTALGAFLADDERVSALRTAARAEARDRAAEWGLADELAE